MRSTVFPHRVLPYLLIAPSAILVIIFFIVPSVQGLQLSFYRVHGFTGRRLFIEFENFTRLLNSEEYLNSVGITAVFVAAVVFFGLAVSLLLAVGASQPLRGFGVYRVLLIWPFALSPAISGTIWALMADPTIGVLAVNLQKVGIDLNYLSNGSHAVALIIVAAVWKILGYNIVFFLAGLKNIPSEVMEAAALDGANGWTRFRKMTFPLLSPTTLFLLVMNTLYACFETFGLIDIMTQGGPGRATNFLVYKLYKDGFVGGATHLGSAYAQSVLLLVFVAGLTLFQFRFAGRRTFYQ